LIEELSDIILLLNCFLDLDETNYYPLQLLLVVVMLLGSGRKTPDAGLWGLQFKKLNHAVANPPQRNNMYDACFSDVRFFALIQQTTTPSQQPP